MRKVRSNVAGLLVVLLFTSNGSTAAADSSLAQAPPSADLWNPFAIARRITRLQKEIEAVQDELKACPELLPSLQTHERIGFYGHRDDPAWMRIDLGAEHTPDAVFVFPARLPITGDVPSPGFPAALVAEISDDESFATSVRIGLWHERQPGDGRRLPFLRIEGNGARGRYLRIRVTGFRPNPAQPQEEFFRLGEIVVLAQGRNVALRRPVTTTRSTDTARRWEPMNLTDGFLWCLPLRGTSGSPANGYHSALEKRELVSGAQWVEVDLGASIAVDELHLVPAHPPDFPDSAGFGFPPRFWVTADAGLSSERELLRETEPPYPAEALPNPGAAAVMIAPVNGPIRHIRVTCESLWRRGISGGRADYFFALSELQAWRGNVNVALGKQVHFADRLNDESWKPEALVDGCSSRHMLLDWSTWLDGITRRHALETEREALERSIGQLQRLAGHRWRMLTVSTVAGIIFAAGMALLFMSRRATMSREALRARIARDLHDEIGASLSHFAMQCELAGRQLENGRLQRARLDSLAGTARETLDNMRDIVWLLAPVGGDWTGFAARMESIGRRLLNGCEHEVRMIGRPPTGNPPIQWARDLVAFLKEALTNARRHSGATRIAMEIRWSDDSLVVDLADNGRGFIPADPSEGSGLRNLRRRSEDLRARLNLDSQPGKGTRIELNVPLPR